jgi:hypothetical protein
MLNTTGVAPGLGSDMVALVQKDGSFGHGWRQDRALLAGSESARNLADIVHHMAVLHGRHPGLVDLAGGGDILGAVQTRIIRGFAQERDFLARLVVAVGPLPATPGHAFSQAAILGQRHALETLAHSDRAGCASGAVAALLMDWAAIRPVLDAAAVRFGLDPVPMLLPDPASLAATIDAVETDAGLSRAIGFGVRQFLLQHRGLWDLLEVRAHARRHG